MKKLLLVLAVWVCLDRSGWFVDYWVKIDAPSVTSKQDGDYIVFFSGDKEVARFTKKDFKFSTNSTPVTFIQGNSYTLFK